MADKPISIRDLKHRIVLCSAKDSVIDNAELAISRVRVFDAWAKIDSYAPSAFSADGFTVNDGPAKITHKLYIRYRPDFSISVSAWAYEALKQSAPRWFRIVSVQDYGDSRQWLCLKAHLHEESDDAQVPKAPTLAQTQLPQGIKL